MSPIRILAWPAFKTRDRNPYLANLYSAVLAAAPDVEIHEFTRDRARRFWEYDILHIHWPDSFVQTRSRLQTALRLAGLLAYLAACRGCGVRVVWTAHNYKRPGGPNAGLVDRLLWRPLARLLSGTIFMTEMSQAEVLAAEPALAGKPHAVIPHGDYRAAMPAVPPVAPPVGLQYFGPINPYKNVPALLRAFAGIPAETGVTLRISGAMSPFSPDPDFPATLAALPPEVAARCRHEDAFQDEEVLIAKVRAADLVVLPYHKVLNSGSALFALSFDTPVLGPRIPLFEELQRQVGADWVMTFEGELDTGALLKAWTAARAVKARGGRPDMARFDWPDIGARTLDFYKRVKVGRE